MAQQRRNPGAVRLVGLAARNLLDMPRIHQDQLAGAFQNVEHWFPIHASRFHRRMRHAVGREPVLQAAQLGGCRAELRDLLVRFRLCPRREHTRRNGFLVDIETRATRVENLHSAPPPEAENGNGKTSLSCVLPCGATLVGASGVPAKLSRGLVQPHRLLRPMPRPDIEQSTRSAAPFQARECRLGRHGWNCPQTRPTGEGGLIEPAA